MTKQQQKNTKNTFQHTYAQQKQEQETPHAFS